jgi:hypothetical protein
VDIENKNIDLSVKLDIFAHTEASFRPSSSLYILAIQKSKFGRLLSSSGFCVAEDDREITRLIRLEMRDE